MHTVTTTTFKPIALAVALAFSAPAIAQQTEQQLPEMKVVDQREAQIERKNAGLQKIVIAEEEVERYGDATVGDILRRLPGMTFSGPAGVVKDIRMRGLDKGYTQFLINGEPAPAAKQERQMQVDRLPADMIERIEIIRSPNAEYDASGIGGTINIVLKSRADDLTRLRAAYGKNGSLNVGDVVAQWSRRFDNLDVVLAASHTVGAEDVIEDKDKFNAAGALTEREHKPRPVEKSETLFAPRLTWRFGEDQLTLAPFVSLGTEDKRETSEVRNGAGVLTKSTANAEDKNDNVARVAGRYDAKTAWGAWFAKAGVQQGKENKDKFATEANGAGVITKRTQEDETVQEDWGYVGVGLAVPLGTHLVKAGLERRGTEYEKRKAVSEASSASGPLVPKAPGPNDIFHIEETKRVAYLQNEWRIADAHWLTPGLRYEETARDATDRTGATRTGATAASNPSLHYRWAAMKNLNFRAGIAQTLKLPKFDDVNPLVTLATGAGAGTSTNPDKGGNADLKPERATGIEIGMEKFFWGNRAVVGLNFYDRQVKDFVQKVAALEGARFVERPQNVGDARFWGGELDWRLPVLRKGEHDLTLTGSRAELRGRVLNAKNSTYGEVKDMPPRVTNLGLDWTHRPSKWSAGFSVNYQPSFTTDTVDPNGAREIKSRNASTLLDLYVVKVFSPQAELRLIAKNVLAVSKDEATSKFKTNGTFDTAEQKVERSKPTIFLTFESRF